MKHLYHLIICLTPAFSFGQLLLGGSDPQQLVANVLSGSGVSISNVQHNGVLDAIAYFSSGSTVGLPYHSGFLMTTGSKYFAQGPNDSIGAGIKNNAPGLTLFNGAFAVESYDASVITFDVIPSGSTLKINYVFGSEEYSSNNSSSYQYNDGFGIFVSGPGINGTQNIARLPNTNPISIRTLNQSTNSQYFVNNGTGNLPPYNSDDQYLQYNGLSKPLTAFISNLSPGSSYHVILVIADGGDALLDSGVFLEEGGVTAGAAENTLDNFVSIAYNSSNQQATIQVTEYQEKLVYSVVDLSGKTMEQSKITETMNLDLSDYASGMYLILVEGSNGQVSKKVVR
ncbi:choice-of-anchor L domain-containing protein [Fluviicola sp.]|uniref:choice-of-anchor L domain-containing protein n=1 Tax=Fluviicola sp. TaxID=1917219 RepID=UPI0031DB5649